MNSENSKTSEPHRLLLNLTDKIGLKRSDKYVGLLNLSIYYIWKNLAPTWNEEFELPDGSYSVTNIQDYFEYILNQHEIVTDNLSIMIYVNKIENWMKFKIKTEYYLKLLTPETMKLCGSTNKKITKNENDENVPHLKITEVVLIHCNIVNNDYQQDSRAYLFLINHLVNY